MDSHLQNLQIYRKEIANDESSLFRAVSEQLFFTQVHHFKIREYCADFIEHNKDVFEKIAGDNFYSMLEKIRDPKQYAGILEMRALAMQYKKSFMIYQGINEPPFTPDRCGGYLKTITLSSTDGIHYDSAYPQSLLSTSAICQSIIYEVLYKRVFKFGECVDMAVSKMLHDKAYSKQRRCHLLNQSFTECMKIDCDEISSEEQDAGLEIKKALAQGIPPFPYKVAKALDPHIYRNVEYDLWNETKKEQLKSEQLVTPEFAPGVKCLVHLKDHKNAFIAYVQEMDSDKGPVSVYVEELCKRHTVTLDSLEILPVPAYKAVWQGYKYPKKISGYIRPNGQEKYRGKKKIVKKTIPQDNSSLLKQCGTSFQEHNQQSVAFSGKDSVSPKPTYFNANKKSVAVMNKWKKKTSDVCFYNTNSRSCEAIQSVPGENNSYNNIVSSQQAGMISRPLESEIYNAPAYVPQRWSQMNRLLPTPPIAIPARPVDANQVMHGQSIHNTPMMEADWSGDPCSLTGSPNVSPIPLVVTPVYPYDTVSCIPSVSESSSPSCGTNSPSSLNSSPSQIPTPCTLSQQSPEEMCVPVSPAGQPVAIYPCSLYTGMFVMYGDGSSHPVNLTQWRQQDYSTNELTAGVTGVYFGNMASPGGGVSPQMAQWVPNYSSPWAAGVQPNALPTFGPPQPAEVNYSTFLNNPPWNQAGFVVSQSPPQMAYQIPTPPHMIAQQSVPGIIHPPA